jgi:hypothetical protein
VTLCVVWVFEVGICGVGGNSVLEVCSTRGLERSGVD